LGLWAGVLTSVFFRGYNTHEGLVVVQKPTCKDVSKAYGINLDFWRAAGWLQEKMDWSDARNPIWVEELTAEVKVSAWLYQTYRKPLKLRYSAMQKSSRLRRFKPS
jgi:hypothetical protein